jgi:hypothetical protein
MRLRFSTIIAALFLLMLPTAGLADLAPYSQDFEALDQADPAALTNDGWLVFGNVFSADRSIYFYGYGPFDAPNGGGGFSGIDIGQGGPEQGAQQLVVYNDYNNGDHARCGGDPLDPTSPLCRFIEANVFQEQVVGAADVGSTWLFDYDAKRGNIGGVTTAKAFIKTLDPNAGYALTNFIWIDMTDVPAEWGSYQIAIAIDATLEGQILQFGFLTDTTAYNDSGIFYDNVNFRMKPISVKLDVKPEGCPNPLFAGSKGVLPVAVVGTVDFDVNDIDVSTLRLEGIAPVNYGYEDVATPYTGDLCGCTESGADGVLDLTLKFDSELIASAIGFYTDSGDQVLTLTGNLLDGRPIEGLDCVFFVGRRRPPRDEGIRSYSIERNLELKLSPVRVPEL